MDTGPVPLTPVPPAGLWRAVHLDDLRRATAMVSDVTKLQDVALSQLFQPEDGPQDDSE